MPPRKKISAPPNRVYESARPKRQAKLPEVKKVIKTYGKKNTRRVAKPVDNDTLTQMWNLPLSREEVEAEDMDIYEAEPVLKRRAKGRRSLPEEEADMDYEEGSKKRRNKRRKTMGDEPESTSKYSTQTITQMDWSNIFLQEDIPENLGVEDNDIYSGPNYSQSLHGRNKPPNLPQPAEPARRTSSRRTQAASTAMPPPQTPRRVFRQEIPSSESPATPLSNRSSQKRSPLKEMAINTPIPFNQNRRGEKSPDKLPRLEVKDTFDTANDTSQIVPISSTPAKRSSPAKSVRFAVLEDEEESPPGSPTLGRISPQKAKGPQRCTMRTEILDSDAESDEESVEPAEAIETTPGEQEEQDVEGRDPEDQEPMPSSPPQFEEQGPETCYGEIGAETQQEAGNLLDIASSTEIVEEDDVEEVEESTFKDRTQMESQRLNTQHVAAMAPRTLESDVFYSIHHTRVTAILNRTRNHETFSKALPPNVQRIWLYEITPLSRLKYMASISPVKRPGDILDESGEGNAEFNVRKGGKTYAYEILGMYELANPLPLAELKSNEWVQRPPAPWSWVRPVVLDQLMANLKPALFAFNSDQETPPSSTTDTQEIGEQLMTEQQHFTQHVLPSSPPVRTGSTANEENLEVVTSSKIVSSNTHEDSELVPLSHPIKSEDPDPDLDEIIPSSQKETTPFKPHLPGPSQATTVDLSQSQTPRPNSLAEIVFESPRRRVTSSTPLRLPTLHSGSSQCQGPESLVPYSMGSSQLLTKSQMLPPGFFGDSVPGPPMFVGDSDEDDSDYRGDDDEL